MPLKEEDINSKGIPISFKKPGGVTVRVGPSSGKALKDTKIPLDGRRYICAGKLLLRNGRELRAHFEIQTHTFDFLDRASVWCYVDGTWYQTNEPELYKVLGIPHSDFFPYRWIPDREIDYHIRGPYPMNWPDKE